QISGNPAEFWPPRLFAFELRRCGDAASGLVRGSQPRFLRGRSPACPIQEVPEFSFTDTDFERLLNALGPAKVDRHEIIGQLGSCARDYLWRRSRIRKSPFAPNRTLR